MWKCAGSGDKTCVHLNFMGRRQCQRCSAPQPDVLQMVDQPWIPSRLPANWDAPPPSRQLRIPGLSPPPLRRIEHRRPAADHHRESHRRSVTPQRRADRSAWSDLADMDDDDDTEHEATEGEEGGGDGGGRSWVQVVSRGERRRRKRQQRKEREQQRSQKQSENQPAHRQHRLPAPGQRRDRGNDGEGDVLRPSAGGAPPPRHDDEMDDGANDETHGQTVQMPEPWEPPKLPRGLIAARHHALEARVRELEGAGAKADGDTSRDKLLREAIRRRDQARGMAKVAGGLTQRKLNFELMSEASNIVRFEKAVEKGQRDVEEAKDYVQEALQYQRDAETALEVAQQKLRNSQDRRAWLATNLAAETNAQKYGGIQEAFATLRTAVQTGFSPELRQQWELLEGFLRSVAPAATQHMDDDPALHGLEGSEANTSVAGEGHGVDEIGDLILQSDLSAARADLADLTKQQEEAVAIAIRQGGSQEHAKNRFESRIQEARQRIQRTETLLTAEAPAAATGINGNGHGPTQRQRQQHRPTMPSVSLTSSITLAGRAPPTPECDEGTAPVDPEAARSPICNDDHARRGQAASSWRRAGSEPRNASVHDQGHTRAAPCAAALPAAFATAERAASACRFATVVHADNMEGLEGGAYLPAANLTRRRREIRETLDGLAKRAAERGPLRPDRASPGKARGRSRSERDCRPGGDDGDEI